MRATLPKTVFLTDTLTRLKMLQCFAVGSILMRKLPSSSLDEIRVKSVTKIDHFSRTMFRLQMKITRLAMA